MPLQLPSPEVKVAVDNYQITQAFIVFARKVKVPVSIKFPLGVEDIPAYVQVVYQTGTLDVDGAVIVQEKSLSERVGDPALVDAFLGKYPDLADDLYALLQDAGRFPAGTISKTLPPEK